MKDECCLIKALLFLYIYVCGFVEFVEAPSFKDSVQKHNLWPQSVQCCTFHLHFNTKKAQTLVMLTMLTQNTLKCCLDELIYTVMKPTG